MMKRIFLKSALTVAAAIAVGCGGGNGSIEFDPDLEVVTTDSGLRYQEITVGEGDPAESDDTLRLHYVGWLEDGTQFDSSRKRGKPYELTLGLGQSIKGMEEGVTGMRAGGKRKLRIPPKLGYGDEGFGRLIPPGAVLIFEVELLEIE